MSTQPLTLARKIIFSLLLLVLGTVLALGFGEMTVRLVAPQQLIMFRPDIWRPADSLGWAQQANIDTRVNTGDRTVTLVTDSNGFRVAPEGRPVGEYRVLLIGDSFMQALQVEYDASLAGLAEQCFQAHTGHTLAVWNTGVGGWDPPQYAIEAKRALASRPFDLVLVSVFLGNDIVTRRQVFRPREPDPRRDLRMPRHLSWREFIDAILAPINDGLETRSHLFIFLKDRFQGLLMRFGLTALEIPTELRRDQAASARWQLTADILAEIDSVARLQDVSTLFMLVPSIEQVDSAALQLRVRAFGVDPSTLDVDQPDRLLAAELERRRLAFVSLLPAFRLAHARGVSLYGRVDPHFSPDGHRLAWNVVAPRLAAALHVPYWPIDDSGPPCGAP